MSKKASGGNPEEKAASLDEEYFRSFLENSPLPVFIIDVENQDPSRHRFLEIGRAHV